MHETIKLRDALQAGAKFWEMASNDKEPKPHGVKKSIREAELAIERLTESMGWIVTYQRRRASQPARPTNAGMDAGDKAELDESNRLLNQIQDDARILLEVATSSDTNATLNLGEQKSFAPILLKIAYAAADNGITLPENFFPTLKTFMKRRGIADPEHLGGSFER